MLAELVTAISFSLGPLLYYAEIYTTNQGHCSKGSHKRYCDELKDI